MVYACISLHPSYFGDIIGISPICGWKSGKISNILFWKFIDLSDLRDELDYDFAAKEFNRNFYYKYIVYNQHHADTIHAVEKIPFFVSSKGFPTLATLKFCYGVNIVQSMGSVICQIIYLIHEPNDHDRISESKNDQAVALLVLSITCTVGGLVVAVLFFAFKGQLLSKVQEHTAQEKQNSTMLEICFSDIYKQERDRLTMLSLDQTQNLNASATSDNDEDQSTFSYVNPMHVLGTSDFEDSGTTHKQIERLRPQLNVKGIVNTNSTMQNRKSVSLIANMANQIEFQKERIEQLLMHQEFIQQNLLSAMTDVRLASISVFSAVPSPPSISDNLFEHV